MCAGREAPYFWAEGPRLRKKDGLNVEISGPLNNSHSLVSFAKPSSPQTLMSPRHMQPWSLP